LTYLAVLVPSRGRPANVARLIEACEKTCEAETVLHFGFDEDDPELAASEKAAFAGRMIFRQPSILVTVKPRMGLAAWTNELAAHHTHAPYLASIGDDMVPVTPGWDRLLIEAQADIGGGITYPNDKRRADIPEAVVIDARIVKALGWMCEPTLGHWYVDAVWRDLGAGMNRLAYRGDVVVEHRHPNVPGGDPPDQTYSDAATGFAADLAAYQKWRLRRMRADIATAREAVGA